MRRVQQMIISAARKVVARDARAVPLVVPHGATDAGRDFESALEILQGSEESRELWRRPRVKLPFARGS